MSWWAEGWAQSDLTGRLPLKLTQFSLGIKVSLDENRANFRASEMVLALPHPPPHIPCSFQAFPSKLCPEGARGALSRPPHSPAGRSWRWRRAALESLSFGFLLNVSKLRSSHQGVPRRSTARETAAVSSLPVMGLSLPQEIT